MYKKIALIAISSVIIFCIGIFANILLSSSTLAVEDIFEIELNLTLLPDDEKEIFYSHDQYEEKLQRLVSIANDNLRGIDISGVQWISLSYIEHEKERNLIRILHYGSSDKSMYITRGRTIGDVPIAIGLYDLNNDGIDELIVFISDSDLHGASSSGFLKVLTYDDEYVSFSRGIAGFPLYTPMLDNQNLRQIGRVNKGGEWDYLLVNAWDSLQPSALFWSTEPIAFQELDEE